MPKRGLRPVYRRPLKELNEANHGELPPVLKDSLEILRERGLHVKSLFSACVDDRKVQLLVRAWDQGHNPLKLAKIQDCYAIADSLMVWLRALPAPIIPCRLFRAFLQAQHASGQAEILSELHLLFQQMQDYEFQTLLLLLGFLHDYLMAQHIEGFMNPTLGQIFGPLVLRENEGSLPLPFPEDVRATADLLDYMIADYPAVFSLQSPCLSPHHKPPSRARRYSGMTRDVVANRPHRGRHHSSSKPAATPAGTESWPIKHLRVNVLPPLQAADVCCLGPEFKGFPQDCSDGNDDMRVPDSPFSPDELSKPEGARLATVPEGRPLAAVSRPQEPELDDVVGKLLCGSMEGTLFENNDHLFMARTSSLMSVSSVNTPRHCSSCGESTDMSSDEELLHDSPCTTPRRKALRPDLLHFGQKGSPSFPGWLESHKA